MQNKFYKIIFINLLFLFSITVNGQVDNGKLHRGFIDISLFIIKSDFSGLNDLQKLDSIYNYSIRYFENDYSEALLALTFAALPFQEMPLKIPIFDFPLNLRLPTIQDDLFKEKVEKLPSKLFINSPRNNFGDKDKISHFFGNAFIKYNFGHFQFASFMGAFVELFEGSFKIAGAVDLRDLYVNKLGELFGSALNENPNILPSSVLSLDALNYLIIAR